MLTFHRKTRIITGAIRLLVIAALVGLGGASCSDDECVGQSCSPVSEDGGSQDALSSDVSLKDQAAADSQPADSQPADSQLADSQLGDSAPGDQTVATDQKVVADLRVAVDQKVVADQNVPSADGSMATRKLVDPQQAQTLIQLGNVTVLDVREQREYDAGHIQGATLLPWNSGVLKKDFAQVPKSKGVLIYCGSPGRGSRRRRPP
jgi:hypothetical protein